MTLAEKVYACLITMPEHKQKEVLDYVEYLNSKDSLKESEAIDKNWQLFSLSHALRGMEEESLYSIDDLKVDFS